MLERELIDPTTIEPYNVRGIHRHAIKRFNYDNKIRGKRYLSPQEERKLLSTRNLLIEEKIDGKLVGAICKTESGRRLVLSFEYVGRAHSISYSQLPSFFVLLDVYVQCDSGEIVRASQKEKTVFACRNGFVHAPTILYLEGTSLEEVGGKDFLRSVARSHHTLIAKDAEVNPQIKSYIEEEAKKEGDKELLMWLERKGIIEGCVVKSDGIPFEGKVVNEEFEKIVERIRYDERMEVKNTLLPFSPYEYFNFFSREFKERKVDVRIHQEKNLCKEGYNRYLNYLDALSSILL